MAVAVAVDVRVGVAVGVRLAVNVAIGEGVDVCVGVNVRVRLGVRVDVGGADGIEVTVGFADGVLVADDAAVVVAVGAPGEAVGVALPDAGGAVAVAEGEVAGDTDTSGVGLPARGVDVMDGACVGASVLVSGAVGGSLKQAMPGSALKMSRQANPGCTRPPVGCWLRPLTMSPRSTDEPTKAPPAGPGNDAFASLADPTPRHPPPEDHLRLVAAADATPGKRQTESSWGPEVFEATLWAERLAGGGWTAPRGVDGLESMTVPLFCAPSRSKSIALGSSVGRAEIAARSLKINVSRTR